MQGETRAIRVGRNIPSPLGFLKPLQERLFDPADPRRNPVPDIRIVKSDFRSAVGQKTADQLVRFEAFIRSPEKRVDRREGIRAVLKVAQPLSDDPVDVML